MYGKEEERKKERNGHTKTQKLVRTFNYLNTEHHCTSFFPVGTRLCPFLGIRHLISVICDMDD